MTDSDLEWIQQSIPEESRILKGSNDSLIITNVTFNLDNSINPFVNIEVGGTPGRAVLTFDLVKNTNSLVKPLFCKYEIARCERTNTFNYSLKIGNRIMKFYNDPDIWIDKPRLHTTRVNNHVYSDCIIISSRNSINDDLHNESFSVSEAIWSINYGLLYVKLDNDLEYFNIVSYY